MAEAEPSKKPMTADEIRAGIEDLAKNGEGADRRWALKTLRGESIEEEVFEPPMDDAEIVQRIGRIMRGGGLANTRSAYARTFDEYVPPPLDVKREVLDIDIDVSLLPKTLRAYYKRYPAFKKDGFPSGYPLGDPVAQMKFVQALAVEREREILRAKAAQVVKHVNRLDDLTTDGADGQGVPPERA